MGSAWRDTPTVSDFPLSSAQSTLSFAQLGVPADLSSVLEARGITVPTPIQTATLPDSLAGRDVLGRGRTGSGKTYAFLLPLVARLAGGRPARSKAPRALILAPTRELATQIEASLAPLAAAEVTVLDEADHMADLGFLPAVRRILDRTPRSGQRLLFSATLDKAIDVIVKRFLDQPVTHEADSVQAPVSAMDHHVLHLAREQRVPVLV